MTLTITESDTGATASKAKDIDISAAPAAEGPDAPAVEDAGPGGCIPGNAILAQHRADKPGGEDFQAPYSASELLELQNAEVNWVREHLDAPCVKALAGSFGILPSELPQYMTDKLHLQETSGLRTQNSFFAASDGHIVWWKVQTFPAGELIWMDANGVEQMKFVCGNRLRPVAPAPASPSTQATQPPATTTSTPPPATSTTPPPPVEKCKSGPAKGQPIPSNGVCPKDPSQDPQAKGNVPTQAVQNSPAPDNSSEVKAPVQPTDAGNGIPSDSTARNTPAPAPTHVSGPPMAQPTEPAAPASTSVVQTTTVAEPPPPPAG